MKYRMKNLYFQFVASFYFTADDGIMIKFTSNVLLFFLTTSFNRLDSRFKNFIPVL